MKTERAIKVLSKYAKVEKVESTNLYFAKRISNRDGVLHTISFHDQAGTAICLHTKRSSDQSDMQSDYYPGSFWDTMAQCLRYGWGIETRKDRMVA